MTLKNAAVELLLHTRETRFDDLVEVPTDCVESLRKALEAENKKEVSKDV